jgi:riboflavin kinase/FMN adenylyltransferase
MEILYNIEKFENQKFSAVTVGTFDGLHLGHQVIIKKLSSVAKQKGVISIIVTFDPHPQTIVKSRKKQEISILTTVNEKAVLLEHYNLDFFIIIQFTKEFSQISSEEFVEDYLVKKLRVKEFVIGHNHAFGNDRKGSIKTLELLSKKFNFNVTVVDPVDYKETLISSTRIRNAIRVGNIYDARCMLGRNYSFSGKVVRGKRRLLEFNIPTANIKPNNSKKLIPKDGIYIAKILVKGDIYRGLLNIGTNPTFNEKELSLEANIFDFQDNIYDEEIIVEVIERLRDERKFVSAEELVKQIQKDKEECVKFFETYEIKEE